MKHATRNLVPPARPIVLPWRVVEHSRNVHSIHCDIHGEKWEQYALLQSDEHFDNPKCDRALYRRHLEEAQERGAPVIKYGDFFCAMQGKWDKRASKDDVRPEHQKGDYLDALVRTAAEWHEPYGDVLAVIGPGNHETAISKHHETNLTERFVEAMRVRAPSTQLCVGGFSGWVRFQFHRGRYSRSIRLWYHHGYGGGGPVTRDVIQSSRRAVYADAEIIASGHTHDEWILPIQRLRLTNKNAVEKFRQLHVKSPGYKDEYDQGVGGFAIERGAPPKPLGAIWLRFYMRDEAVRVEAREAQ